MSEEICPICGKEVKKATFPRYENELVHEDTSIMYDHSVPVKEKDNDS